MNVWEIIKKVVFVLCKVPLKPENALSSQKLILYINTLILSFVCLYDVRLKEDVAYFHCLF